MSYNYLEVIFDEDYTEDNDVLGQLKAALADIEKVYLVTNHDNGAKFVVNESCQAAVVNAVAKGGFTIVDKSSISGTKTLLLIVRPERNDFGSLDDKRLKELWS